MLSTYLWPGHELRKLFFLPSLGAVLTICMPEPVAAQNGCPPRKQIDDRDKNYALSVNLDNDFFAGKDSSYTNGLRAVVSRPIGSTDNPNTELSIIENRLPEWLKFGYSNQFYNSRGFGSSIFTPEDTSAVNPPADQRPYASYLYFLSGVETEQVDFNYQPDEVQDCRLKQITGAVPIPEKQEGISKNFWLSTRHFDSMELQVGWIGPHAYGEEILETFHSVWPAGGNAAGWQSRQIKDEPVVNFFYNRVWTGFPLPGLLPSSQKAETKWQRRLYLYEHDPKAYKTEFPDLPPPDRNTPPRSLELGPLKLDLRPHAGFALGNLHTFGAVGTVARLGLNVPDNIGPPLIRPTLPGSDHFAPRNFTNTALYAFAGVESRAVFYNATLDGNLFRESPSVDKKYLVQDLQVGAALEFSALRISYGRVYRTAEFDGQKDTSFGAVNVGINFKW